MEENILEELWYGNIHPQEQSYSRTPVVKKLLKCMQQSRERLTEPMTEEQRHILAEYEDGLNEMNSLMEREIVAYGFRFGGKLMLAMMTDSAGSEQ